MGMLMLTTILLIGFAPVAWLFSQSTNSICWMGTLHLIFWFIASLFRTALPQHRLLAYAGRNPNAGFNTWVVIFMLVVVQMTTALRPILGTADTFFPKTKQFFLSHWAECLKNESDAKPELR